MLYIVTYNVDFKRTKGHLNKIHKKEDMNLKNNIATIKSFINTALYSKSLELNLFSIYSYTIQRHSTHLTFCALAIHNF